MGSNPGYLLKSFLLYWKSANCHFRTPFPPYKCSRNIWMVPMLIKVPGGNFRVLVVFSVWVGAISSPKLRMLFKLGCVIILCWNFKKITRSNFMKQLLSTAEKIEVENILKGNLNLIPSHLSSLKIQIMGGKVCLRCKGKTLLVVVNNQLKTKSLLTSSRQCFALFPQVTFPPKIWI